MWNLNLRTSKLEVLLNWVLKFFLPILLIDWGCWKRMLKPIWNKETCRVLQTVHELTWGDDPEPELIELPSDYELGSDVIYSEVQWMILSETLMQSCGAQTTVVLAGELRNMHLNVGVLFEVKGNCTWNWLGLISKIHVLEQAEKYFNETPKSSRSFQVHGALLNCYSGRNHWRKRRPLCKDERHGLKLMDINILQAKWCKGLIPSGGQRLVDGFMIKEGDYKLVKTRFSASFAPLLHSFLQSNGINIIVGVQTPNCIRQMVLGAVALDYQPVTVIVDARDCFPTTMLSLLALILQTSGCQESFYPHQQCLGCPVRWIMMCAALFHFWIC